MGLYKIADAEWKVMDIIWSAESISELNTISKMNTTSTISAKEVVEAMKESESWNKNTTYTVLNRLVQKGLIGREEPGFICKALVTRDEVSLSETRSFLEKVYNGSIKMLVSSFINNEELTDEELEELKKLIDKKRDGKKG